MEQKEDQTGIMAPETEVLIVDDNPQYSLVLSKILEASFGYKHITKVTSTEAARELIAQDPDRFKLLFVDYRFPDGHSGGELLEALKRNELMKDKVAFLVTSEPTPENMKQARDSGAVSVLAKPFDRDALRRNLEKAERTLGGQEWDEF